MKAAKTSLHPPALHAALWVYPSPISPSGWEPGLPGVSAQSPQEDKVGPAPVRPLPATKPTVEKTAGDQSPVAREP